MNKKNKISTLEQKRKELTRNLLLSMITPTALLIIGLIVPEIIVLILGVYVWIKLCRDINQYFHWEPRREIEPRELGFWALYPLLWVMEQPGYKEWEKKRDAEITADIRDK